MAIYNKKTFTYMFTMQLLWMALVIVKGTGVWFAEAAQIFILFTLVVFCVSLISDTKLRCLKSTFICIGIYLGIVFCTKYWIRKIWIISFFIPVLFYCL